MEPRVDPARELEAIIAAFLDEPFIDPPTSDVLVSGSRAGLRFQWLVVSCLQQSEWILCCL